MVLKTQEIYVWSKDKDNITNNHLINDDFRGTNYSIIFEGKLTLLVFTGTAYHNITMTHHNIKNVKSQNKQIKDTFETVTKTNLKCSINFVRKSQS